MALVKPLVLGANGQIMQISSSDTLNAAVQEADAITLTNGTTGAIAFGKAVYISASNSCALAMANASATKQVLGLVKDASIAANAVGNIQTDGVITGTTAQWDAAIGGSNSGGLTSGAVYYLSATVAGGITSTPPSTTGQYLVPIGVALSTTSLDIRDALFDILL